MNIKGLTSQDSSQSFQEQEKRKKRELSLCLVRTRDVPVYVKLVLVKRTEKDTYKRKVEWQLRDLKVLDGLAADSAEMRFELEERHTWLAASLEEKEAFLKVVPVSYTHLTLPTILLV